MALKGVQNVQFAALPYRQRSDTIEILLITSRDTGRWLIPKGWPEPGLHPAENAAREAYEEGGLVGRIDEHAIGTYRYEKLLPDGSARPCVVEVFALEVERQRRSWPERSERRTRWFPLPEAAEAVREPELREIIQGFADKMSGK